jgi:hypothetical protein
MPVAKVEDLREAAPWLFNLQSRTGSVIARVGDTALGMPRGTPQCPSVLALQHRHRGAQDARPVGTGRQRRCSWAGATARAGRARWTLRRLWVSCVAPPALPSTTSYEPHTDGMILAR